MEVVRNYKNRIIKTFLLGFYKIPLVMFIILLPSLTFLNLYILLLMVVVYYENL